MKTPVQHTMMAVLFVGLLLATAQCRPEAGRTKSFYSGSKGGGGGGTDANTETSLRSAPLVSRNKTAAMEEGKLYIKFCIHRECKLDDKLYEECGCCAFLFPYPKCFKTQQECQANCPACHPHCPPESPAPSPPPPPSPSLPPPLPPLPPLPSLPSLPPPPPTMA